MARLSLPPASAAGFFRPVLAAGAALFLGLSVPGIPLFAQDAGDDFDMDSLFEDPGALEIEESDVVENPEASLFADQAFTWSGDFTGRGGAAVGWEDLPPSAGDLDDYDDALVADLKLRLWFDARPDKDYRVFGKFVTSWPFAASAVTADPSSPGGYSEVTVPNLQVFELFADFNWDNRVFFRFGKQTSGWGLSRFYQIGDPLSVAVKDPEDPAADLEGPVALRLSVPLGVNTVYLWSALKDSYLPSDGSAAGVSNLGFGAKGDFLVPVPKNPVLSNGELSLGAWYQKDIAPRAVAGYSTAIGDFQVFSDQLVTWGLDSARIVEGTGGGLIPADTEKPGDGFFWSATAGTMYVNNDWHFTAYGEYLFNGAGSSDRDIYELFAIRSGAESDPASGLPATLSSSDLFGYLARHNSGLSLSWSELFGNDKLAFSALWLQDWVDFSGMGNGKLTFSPFDRFSVEASVNLAWGGKTDEWVLKTGRYDAAKGFVPVRAGGSLVFSLGTGKF